MLHRMAMALVLVALASACRHKPAEGPAETAGKKVDNAAEKTKDAAKDGVDATKNAAKDTKEEVKKKTN